MQVVVDVSQAGLPLEAEELEVYAHRLVTELQDVDFAENTALVREEKAPSSSMAGEAAFLLGVLQTEVTAQNIGKLMAWLWSLKPSTLLKIIYKNDGKEVILEYRNKAELDQQLDALHQIDSIMVQLIQVK